MMILFGVFFLLTPSIAAGCGQENVTDISGNQQLCFNLKCPETLPRTCKDVVSSEPRVVVTLWNGLKVLCDTQSDGGGWTVIQRRTTGDLDFYRNWEEYKTGFGVVGDESEFWIGNENIHHISSRSPHELRIDFKYSGSNYFARYSHFRVFSEPEQYKLSVGGYSGNAGDSLTHQNNMKFSTKDRDNDVWTNSCAVSFHGAWWYTDCHLSNLNGLWGSKDYAEGLTWHATTGYYDTANFTEIKIRPIN